MMCAYPAVVPTSRDLKNIASITFGYLMAKRTHSSYVMCPLRFESACVGCNERRLKRCQHMSKNTQT